MPPTDNFPTYQVFVLASSDVMDLGYSCTIKFRMNLEIRLQITQPSANHLLITTYHEFDNHKSKGNFAYKF